MYNHTFKIMNKFNNTTLRPLKTSHSLYILFLITVFCCVTCYFKKNCNANMDCRIITFIDTKVNNRNLKTCKKLTNAV